MKKLLCYFKCCYYSSAFIRIHETARRSIFNGRKLVMIVKHGCLLEFLAAYLKKVS